MSLPFMFLCILVPGTSRFRWCWWATRWTWRTRERCPPVRVRRWPRTGAAPSWRPRPRARPWWTSCSPRSCARWTSAPCRTGGRRAVPPAASSNNRWLHWKGNGENDSTCCTVSNGILGNVGRETEVAKTGPFHFNITLRAQGGFSLEKKPFDH